jgi:predicted metal-dependent HD superfamily phosphohydrolase
MDNSLLLQIESYISKLMGGDHETAWPFHNIHHVRLVVDKCRELARAYDLSAPITEELIIAAWFHDTGYVHGSAGHELQSCKIALTFLSIYDCESVSAFRIASMILATRYPGSPATLEEKILCDADLFHLASDNYAHWSGQLFKEANLHQQECASPQDWLHTNITFLSTHQYFTDYAQEHWAAGKLRNLEALRREVLPSSGS